MIYIIPETQEFKKYAIQVRNKLNIHGIISKIDINTTFRRNGIDINIGKTQIEKGEITFFKDGKQMIIELV
jgi:hypothetical protein